MRVTQGAFSFLPDFTDDQIAAQIRYALDKGWSMSVEYTDDAHPRNSYWEMWSQPYFELLPEDYEVVLREVGACREAHPDHYVKLIAYDARYALCITWGKVQAMTWEWFAKYTSECYALLTQDWERAVPTPGGLALADLIEDFQSLKG